MPAQPHGHDEDIAIESTSGSAKALARLKEHALRIEQGLGEWSAVGFAIAGRELLAACGRQAMNRLACSYRTTGAPPGTTPVELGGISARSSDHLRH